MITVCAWCQRMLGADPEDRSLISHGMCSGCQTAARARDAAAPTLVVPVRYAELVSTLDRLLRETGIAVVLDRRVAQRRQTGNGASGDDRRCGADRRRSVEPEIH